MLWGEKKLFFVTIVEETEQEKKKQKENYKDEEYKNKRKERKTRDWGVPAFSRDHKNCFKDGPQLILCAT